jgi:hypothetical protein
MTGETVKIKIPETVSIDEFNENFTKIRIEEININLKKKNVLRSKKLKNKIFKEAVDSIPNVAYNPHTAMQFVKSTAYSNLFNSSSLNDDNKLDELSFCAENDDDKIMIEKMKKHLNTKEMNEKHEIEQNYLLALEKAKNGNKRALVDFFMYDIES